MSQVLSTPNPYYTFKYINDKSALLTEKTNENDLVVSYYVWSGELKIFLKDKLVKILENEVIILSSVQDINKIEISEGAKILEISSKKTTDEVIEIIDDNGLRSECSINNYKIYKNHKKVISLGVMKFGLFG